MSSKSTPMSRFAFHLQDPYHLIQIISKLIQKNLSNATERKAITNVKFISILFINLLLWFIFFNSFQGFFWVGLVVCPAVLALEKLSEKWGGCPGAIWPRRSAGARIKEVEKRCYALQCVGLHCAVVWCVLYYWGLCCVWAPFVRVYVGRGDVSSGESSRVSRSGGQMVGRLHTTPRLPTQ